MTVLRVLILLFVAASAWAAGLRNLSCEQIGPARYRITFQTAADTGRVKIFESSRPDRIDGKMVVVTTASPAEVSVSAVRRRVYFHLHPERGATRVVASRRIPLQGAANFRDLGGYAAAEGKSIRWDSVYRSNHLVALTSDDYRYVTSLGIRAVCDLRTDDERRRAPTRWLGFVPEFLQLPVGGEVRGHPGLVETVRAQLARGAGAEVIRECFRKGYAEIVLENAAQYGVILQKLAGGELPVLVHCSGGKDRTGVFSALLLTILGVPSDTVFQDYLLTNEYVLREPELSKTVKGIEQALGVPVSPVVIPPLLGAEREFLDAAFEAIRRQCGSFDSYRRNSLGVSDGMLRRLRDRLLVE